jgi:hypothetical protein
MFTEAVYNMFTEAVCKAIYRGVVGNTGWGQVPVYECSVQFSAVQCSAVQCSAVQCERNQLRVFDKRQSDHSSRGGGIVCLHTVQTVCGVYSSCTVYSVQCTVYTVQHAVWS